MGKLMEAIKSLLTSTGKIVQSASFSWRLWTPAVQMNSVKGNQVPTLLFLQRDFKNPTDEHLLLGGYMWTAIGWRDKNEDIKTLNEAIEG